MPSTADLLVTAVLFCFISITSSVSDFMAPLSGLITDFNDPKYSSGPRVLNVLAETHPEIP